MKHRRILNSVYLVKDEEGFKEAIFENLGLESDAEYDELRENMYNVPTEFPTIISIKYDTLDWGVSIDYISYSEIQSLLNQ